MIISDPAIKKRVDQAWEESKTWITEFDGSPMIALLVNVPAGSLLPALGSLAQASENFRITMIPTGRTTQPEFISLEALPGKLSLLQEGKIAELSVNYAARLEAFDLDIHMVVHSVDPQKLALELVWWSDQVFSEETESYAQFAALAGYFIYLQTLFDSPNLFVSPEGGSDPVQDSESWVEI